MEGDAGKLFCGWESDDVEAIHASLKPVEDIFPIEAIYQVTWIDPAWHS